ncbi:hypothetical protein KA068_01800 [Candidatus Saccharibacteria bacterium]|nr:hypothetical protein [Candidatus Saccharibacteria bacterium]
MSDVFFTNGAIQNRGFELDESPGKITGIMLAQVLNRLNGNAEAVHLWNNVGAFHNDEPQNPQLRLEQKYLSRIMTSHMEYWDLAPEYLQIISDDDERFAEWTIKQLEELIEAGNITIEQAEFDSCPDCDMVVAESVVEAQCCSQCKSEDLRRIVEGALFVTMPENRMQLLDDSLIYNSMNLRNERDSLKQIPPRLLLSRDREIGVRLDDLGLSDKKLDPRLGIGMLALYAAEVNDFETVAMTQTTSTLIRTVPYIGSILLTAPDSRRLLFVPHTRIDSNVFDEADEVGRQVIAPFAAAQRNQDVNMQRYQYANKEFMKLGRNAAALAAIIERLGLAGRETEPSFKPDHSGLTDIVSGMGKQSGYLIEALKRRVNATGISEDTISDVLGLISITSALKL